MTKERITYKDKKIKYSDIMVTRIRHNEHLVLSAIDDYNHRWTFTYVGYTLKEAKRLFYHAVNSGEIEPS